MVREVPRRPVPEMAVDRLAICQKCTFYPVEGYAGKVCCFHLISLAGTAAIMANPDTRCPHQQPEFDDVLS
jgi:hypothetical protein